MSLKGFLLTWGFTSKERTNERDNFSKHIIGITAELLSLSTPEEIARQERIVTEIPKEKPPIYYEDGSTTAVIYSGRVSSRWNHKDARE